MEKVHTIDVSSFSFVDKNASVTEQLGSSHCNNCSKIVPLFKCQKWVGIRTETNAVPRSTEIQVKISGKVLL